MGQERILVVDDDAAFTALMREVLEPGYEVVAQDSVAGFRKVFPRLRFDLIILDMRLETEREGLGLLREIMRQDPLQAVIVATAYPDTESYLEALEAGALSFLDKHEFSPALVARTVEEILQRNELRKRVDRLERQLSNVDPLEIVGVARETARIRECIREAAERGVSPVLVYGEPGTGRELIARNIHYMNRCRREEPFIEATASKMVKEGDKFTKLVGVLFIRELGDLDDDTWMHLERQFAGNRLPSFQLIAATRYDIRELTERGTIDQAFRAKLEAYEIIVPPLRERQEDIPLLATYFLQNLFRRGRTSARVFDREVLTSFEHHPWPGNVRELQCVVEYAAIAAEVGGDEELNERHLPYGMAASKTPSIADDGLDYQLNLDRAELQLVNWALQHSGRATMKQLAAQLGYNDRYVLARRVKKALGRFPRLEEEFSEVAGVFQKKRGRGRNVL